MRQCALERSLHILGPVLGRKRGVEVRVGGGRASTDGNTIWLPALPLEDAEAAVLGFGLLFHETNHVRYTDFAVEKGTGLVGALTNALEDIRIDALGHREYPGGRREEEALVAALVARGEAKSCAQGDPPARILENYVMWRLEHDVLGIEAAGAMAQHCETLFRETFPPGLQTKLDALMFGVRRCSSTAQVKALAGEIAQMLEEEARAEEREAAQKPADGGQQSAPQAGAVQPAQPAPQPGPIRQALNAGPQEHVSGIGEMAQAAVNDKAQHSAGSSLPMLTARAPGEEGRVVDGGAFAMAVKAASNALRQRIAGLLQAQTLSRRYPALSGRRIDARRLGRIETGELRLFVRECAGLKTDTAVQILVDRSGSMRSASGRERSQGMRPIEVARQSCYAAALALQQVPQVSVSVAAFPGNGPGELIVLAHFAQRIERQAARFASLEAGGGTPMAEAMLWGAAQLLAQRRPRRILMVITDGAYDEARGKSMVARLAGAGIETIGIGIQCRVSHLFGLCRDIASVTALPQAMFELLLDAMRRPAVHR